MPKELTAFRMAPDLMEAMRRVKEREGIPIAVQLDFAVRAWMKKRGTPVGEGPKSRKQGKR